MSKTTVIFKRILLLLLVVAGCSKSAAEKKAEDKEQVEKAKFAVKAKDWQGAIEHATKALDVDDKNCDALVLRALCYQILSIGQNPNIENAELAAKDYRRVLEVEPNHPEKAEFEKYIRLHNEMRQLMKSGGR